MRIGMGYDSHRFAPERPLILAGVRIEHELGLSGHSDADVAAHAVIDAICGAAGLGDIGTLFPDSDEQYRAADSCQLLAETVARARRKGWTPINCDLTIITETPRLGPHKGAMRKNLAELLGLDAAAVSVKAKTNEKMGFVGRREGMAAMAAVLLGPV
ncbi:MAG: 2-C-methyl-D-erythritol 2,4-cyclodiphosphate synthase [Phycisphaerae bacterium]